MPGTLREKYSVADVHAGQELACTILYGFLGNAVDENTKYRIFKNISYMNTVIYGNSTIDQIREEYGDDLADEAERFRYYSNTTEHSQEPNTDLVQDHGFTHYTDEGVEDTLEYYRQSMQELSDLLRQNEHRIHFASDLERDYFNVLRQQVDILASGNSMHQRCIDDTAFAFSRSEAARLGFIGGTYEYDALSKKFTKQLVEPEVDTHTFFNRVKDTGIIQAVVGATCLSNKFENFNKDGRIGRGELIEETRLQLARMKKLMSMDEKTHAPLFKDKILQSSLEEFTDGDRGPKNPLWDVEAKLELLTSGWPVQDIPGLAKLYRSARNAWQEFDKASSAYEIYADNHPNPTNEEKAEIDRLKTEKDKYEDAFDKLKSCWDDVKSSYNMSQADRQRILNNIATKTSSIEGDYKPSMLDSCIYNVRKSLTRQLSNDEKILMAGNMREVYNIINDDDPALMISSSEFRSMKKSLDKLADMEPNKEDNYEEYEKQRAKTIKLMQQYLSYKHVELNDPSKPHERSEREAKRVKDVEAALYRLKAQDVKPKEAAKNSEIYSNPEKRLTESPASTAFEKFIKQHTGYHQINGPESDLADHVAMVMAATYIRSKGGNAPIALADIERYAIGFKNKYKLDYANPDSLKKALTDPKTILNFTTKNREELYGMKGLTENEYRYNDFIKDMRVIYKNIPDPEGEPAEYQKVFNSVHEMAKLPANLKDMDKDKINAAIQKHSRIIMDNADSFLQSNPQKSSAARGMLDAMATLKQHNQECTNFELSRYIDDIVSRTNKQRGSSKNLDNSSYIDLEDDYGPKKIRSIRKHENGGEDLRPEDKEGRRSVQDYYKKDNDEDSLFNKSIISIKGDDEEIIKTDFNAMYGKQKDKNNNNSRIKDAAKKRNSIISNENIIDTSSGKKNKNKNDFFMDI